MNFFNEWTRKLLIRNFPSFTLFHSTVWVVWCRFETTLFLFLQYANFISFNSFPFSPISLFVNENEALFPHYTTAFESHRYCQVYFRIVDVKLRTPKHLSTRFLQFWPTYCTQYYLVLISPVVNLQGTFFANVESWKCSKNLLYLLLVNESGRYG